MEQNLSLGNTLMYVYGNRLLPDEVRTCFRLQKQRNDITWNLGIRAYAHFADNAHETFRLFAAMQDNGSESSKFLFASILSACGAPDSLVDGRLIHCLIVCQGCKLDVVLGTALVGMYRRFRSFQDAYTIFWKLPEQNAACWNVIATLLAQFDANFHIVGFMRDMHHHNIVPEKATFLIALDLFNHEGSISEAKQLHVWIKESRSCSSIMVMTALVKMYGCLNLFSDAQRIFEQMPEKDLVAWNALIAVYAQKNLGEAAIDAFRQMQLERFQPTKVTLLSVLDACASRGHGILGKRIHSYIIQTGCKLDVVLGTSLLSMHGRCVSLEDAWHVLREMPEPNIISWNAMMAAYIQAGEAELALQVFEHALQEGFFPDNATFLSMSDAAASVLDSAKGKQLHTRVLAVDGRVDVVVGSSLISMYGAFGDLKSARTLFDVMDERNSVTLTNMLTVCANLGALTEGEWLHTYIVQRKLLTDVVIDTALVNMYGKCGLLDTAWTIFLDMSDRNAKSWNAMLGAYTQQGDGKHAIRLFHSMQQSGMLPDETTFVSVFCACSHSGLIDEGCYFFLLLRTYGLTPIVDHYNCILDMLCRAGRLDEAEVIIMDMSLRPTQVSWSTLLGACQNQVDRKRGAVIANQFFALYPHNPSAYVTLGNMYAGVSDDVKAHAVFL
ncbi:hypothetical protein KP509_33G052800 [Ceratopteris richardii]|nr:hypothetical protein KP509_33G052800 [Ceratopteris richardii]